MSKHLTASDQRRKARRKRQLGMLLELAEQQDSYEARLLQTRAAYGMGVFAALPDGREVSGSLSRVARTLALPD